eukprot:TRINITY_DN4087_c0_g1_i3.p2 TRINITY_DN4087_c0_g1~~TRINITY_DN4087_c0_g1_i3.p2  ORF type:complete len:252 (+),score=50.55 TRINITY_DN4087_c0_g1_i3:75-830(+)
MDEIYDGISAVRHEHVSRINARLEGGESHCTPRIAERALQQLSNLANQRSNQLATDRKHFFETRAQMRADLLRSLGLSSLLEEKKAAVKHPASAVQQSQTTPVKGTPRGYGAVPAVPLPNLTKQGAKRPLQQRDDRPQRRARAPSPCADSKRQHPVADPRIRLQDWESMARRQMMIQHQSKCDLTNDYYCPLRLPRQELFDERVRIHDLELQLEKERELQEQEMQQALAARVKVHEQRKGVEPMERMLVDR